MSKDHPLFFHFGDNKRKSATEQQESQKRKRGLKMEPLEDRCMLAADLIGQGVFDDLQVDNTQYHGSRVIVQFAENLEVPASFKVAGHDFSVGERMGGKAGLRQVNVPKGMDVNAAVEQLKGRNDVVFAELDYRVSLSATPNDPSFSSLWGLNNTGQSGGTIDADIDALEAWEITTGSASTIVAVIDTGVDYNHVDLAGNIWVNTGEIAGNGVDDDGNGFVDDIHGYDFADNDANPIPDSFSSEKHGTHVAGTIGAMGDNGIGVVGVNWDVQIMSLRFLDESGSGYTSDAVGAVYYAIDNGATISNNSWGGGGYSQSMYDAIAYGQTKNHIFVAAAGNSSSNNDSSAHYPSNYNLDNVVSVASTDRYDELSSFSSYGATTVDLAAPGSSIYSTFPGDTYGTYSGTSMATPHVAGAMALVLSEYPDLSYGEVLDRIYSSVDTLGSLAGKMVTGGRLNAAAALAAGNGSPIAEPDTYGAFDEDTTLIVDALNGVLDNDSDPEGDPITAVLVNGPANGVLTLNDDGSFSYTPDENYNGSDSFTYKATDGVNFSNEVTVTLSVAAVNDAPVAVQDANYSVDADNTLTVNAANGVLTNDSDPDGDSITAVLVSGPSNGVLTLNDNGSFEYTPTNGFSGSDSFTYKANDTQLDSNQITVTIDVIGANTVDFHFSVNSNGVSVGGLTVDNEDIVAKLSDGDYGFVFDGSDMGLSGLVIDSFMVTGPDTILLSFTGSAGITGLGTVDDSDIIQFTGTFGADTTGTFSWYFDGSDVGLTTNGEDIDAFTILPDGSLLVSTAGGYSVPGASGSDEDLIQFTGTYGATTTGSWEIYFDGSDVGLSTSSSEDVNAVSVDSDGNILLSTRGNFSVSGVSGADEDIFVFVPTTLGSNTSGSFQSQLFFDGSAAGLAGTDIFGLSVAVDSNESPIAEPDTYGAFDEDTTLIVDAATGVLANDKDPENDSLTAVLVSGPANGVLTLNDDGSFSYTPDENYNGSDSFTYKATDGVNFSNEVTVTLSVAAVNDAPVAVQDANYSVDADNTLTVNAANGVLTNDSDPDGDSITAVLVSGPSNGVLTLNDNGSFDYTPTNGFSGSDSFTYKANDTQLDSNQITVTIDVIGNSGTKFFVVDSGSDDTFEYAADGSFVENYNLASSSAKGVTTTPDGSIVWVIDNNDYVYVYDNSGNLLGNWYASGLNRPEGIALDGDDLLIVDRGMDAVLRYTGAAAWRSGSIGYDTGFYLTSGNSRPYGITTDGTSFWVVDDQRSGDFVYKYSVDAGAYYFDGVWTLDSANSRPRGITIDPNDVNHLWIVDSARDDIFEYQNSVNRTGGSFAADQRYDLAAGNGGAQGIADPDSSLADSSFESIVGINTNANGFRIAVNSLNSVIGKQSNNTGALPWGNMAVQEFSDWRIEPVSNRISETLPTSFDSEFQLLRGSEQKFNETATALFENEDLVFDVSKQDNEENLLDDIYGNLELLGQVTGKFSLEWLDSQN